MEAQQIEARQSTTYKAELNNDMKDATPTHHLLTSNNNGLLRK